jgi:hypothetical protein
MAERRKISPEENIPALADLPDAPVRLTKLWALRRVKQLRPDISHMRRKLNASRCKDVRSKWRGRLAAPTAALNRAKGAYRDAQRPGKGRVGTGLDAIGALATFSGQLDDSTATTMTGKVVDGVLAGTGDVILGKTPVAAADAVVQLGLQTVGVDPKGWTVGDNVNTGFRALVTSAEAGITGNYSGVATFDEKARSGGYGPPAQVLGHFGADIGKDGLVATVGANLAYYWHYAVGR